MNDEPEPQKPPMSKVGLVVVSVLVVLALAFLAWWMPAASKAGSQDMAVSGNLRQLSTGADLYYLEHGVTSVAFTEFVGTYRSQYITDFHTVANETYPAVMVQGRAITASGIASARTVTYGN